MKLRIIILVLFLPFSNYGQESINGSWNVMTISSQKQTIRQQIWIFDDENIEIRGEESFQYEKSDEQITIFINEKETLILHIVSSSSKHFLLKNENDNFVIQLEKRNSKNNEVFEIPLLKKFKIKSDSQNFDQFSFYFAKDRDYYYLVVFKEEKIWTSFYLGFAENLKYPSMLNVRDEQLQYLILTNFYQNKFRGVLNNSSFFEFVEDEVEPMITDKSLERNVLKDSKSDLIDSFILEFTKSKIRQLDFGINKIILNQDNKGFYVRWYDLDGKRYSNREKIKWELSNDGKLLCIRFEEGYYIGSSYLFTVEKLTETSWKFDRQDQLFRRTN